MTDFTKKCDCGHVGNEHLWVQKSVTKLAFLGDGFFRTPQEGRGLCRKCSCPEYEPPSRRHPRDIKYTSRAKNNDVDPGKRCTRCGRLLSNHVDVNHTFQE